MKRKYLNTLSKFAVVAAVISMTSCKEEGGLAPEYMPDMYRSPAVEAYVDYGELRGNYSSSEYTDKMTARQPVEGTVARGYMPYNYKNTPEDYLLAGANVKNPIAYSDDVVKEGEKLYGMFCIHCHGKTGQGDGSLVKNEKFPPLPVKFAEGLDIPEGRMFHTITYGKGLMGSHASQLRQDERWKLIHYIRSNFLNEKPVAPSVGAGSGGPLVASSSNLVFTGNVGNDLDLLFDFFDMEEVEDESLPTRSPALVLQNVIFDQGKAKLNIPESQNTLDLLSEKLKAEKYNGYKIQLNGHTHKGLGKMINLKLSEKRANAVKEYLVSKGIDAARISTKGYGQSQLLSEESTEEAKAKNRRTEIIVIK